MALSVISWLFNLICEPGRDRLEEANLFDDDAGTSSTRGVMLAEQQSFTSFLSQLLSLLSRSLGSHPPSIHLMGLPALPSSLLREKRPRFVSSRALQALVKAGPGPDPTADEECYICLRPVGTKNLPSTTSSKAGKLCGGGFGASSKRDDCAAADDAGETDDETTDREDENDAGGDKGRFQAPRLQRSRHEDGGEGDCNDEQHLKQQQRLRRQSSPGSSSSSSSSSGGGGGSSSGGGRSGRQTPTPPRAILRLPCGHRYCDCCLRRWLSAHSSCPTCRWAFPERDCETVPKEF